MKGQSSEARGREARYVPTPRAWSEAVPGPQREFLVALRVKADYDNDGPYRGPEDVVLIEASDRWEALDRALGTRNIPSEWYVYSIDSDA